MLQLQVYLAGPITGVPDRNQPAFAKAAGLWRARGWRVFDPIEADGDNLDDAWETYMRRDIPILVESDAIALLPGWQASRGATLEAHIAEQLGIRRFDALYAAPHPITSHIFVEGHCCDAPDYNHHAGWLRGGGLR